jgi:hypothetical protein
MPNMPAMTTGIIDFIMISGLSTPVAHIPTPDLAVPIAEPRST